MALGNQQDPEALEVPGTDKRKAHLVYLINKLITHDRRTHISTPKKPPDFKNSRAVDSTKEKNVYLP